MGAENSRLEELIEALTREVAELRREVVALRQSLPPVRDAADSKPPPPPPAIDVEAIRADARALMRRIRR